MSVNTPHGIYTAIGNQQMLDIPPEILDRFAHLLEKRAVPSPQHFYYKKWLRYYLDYCAKYEFRDASSRSLTQFLGMLREKKQTEAQIFDASLLCAYDDERSS
jgi:hypothetical protein